MLVKLDFKDVHIDLQKNVEFIRVGTHHNTSLS